MKKRAEPETEDTEDSLAERIKIRSLIRPTLLGDQLGINEDEYIGRRLEADGELSPDASLPGIHPSLASFNEKEAPSKESRIHGRKAIHGGRGSSGRESVGEYYMTRLFSAIGGGFDLEMWWRRGLIQNRLTGIMLVILFAVTLLNFLVGIAFIAHSIFTDEANRIDPYVCRTEDCKKAGVRLAEPMSKEKDNIDPCDNFYEYMCKTYEETDDEGPFYGELVTTPSILLQLGKDSVLGRILKDRTDYNQHITFYQTCLNNLNREKSKHEILVKSAEEWFGTSDFNTFENHSKPMEQIAADTFKAFGHAGFINMAFYTYPYILILEPQGRTTRYRFDRDPRNKEFLKKLLQGLMPLLGSTNLSDEIINNMVSGTNAMSKVVYEIHSAVKNISVDPTSKTTPPEITGLINGEKLKGLCPPMGMNLSYFGVLDLFINETYKVEYITPTARKFVQALELCFNQPKDNFKFAEYSISKGYARTAFVALWVVNIFYHDLVIGMDHKNIPEKWGLEKVGKDISLIGEIDEHSVLNDEYTCLETLWTVLGYMPTIQFLKIDHRFPEHWMHMREREISDSYAKAQKYLRNIPPEEIDWRTEVLGTTVFKRGLDANVGLPLVGGILDTKVRDLVLTNDFLENVITGFRYTVEWSRHNWLGGTDPKPYIKWFGSGGPGHIKDTLFVPHYVRSYSGRFAETGLAVKKDEWEMFLGRKPNNYVRIPLSIYDEKEGVVLPVKYGTISVPVYQTILGLLNDANSKTKYPSLTLAELIGNRSLWNLGDKRSNRTCKILQTTTSTTHESRQEFKMITFTTSDYTWEQEHLFLALAGIKLAYKDFKEDRARLDKLRYNYNLKEEDRRFIVQKYLPDKFKKVSEEKLFFMVYVRQICRESWKSSRNHTEEQIQKQYSLETTLLSVLMQMEEFSRAFNCPQKSLMNNKGEPRCIRDWTG